MGARRAITVNIPMTAFSSSITVNKQALFALDYIYCIQPLLHARLVADHVIEHAKSYFKSY